VRYFGGTANEKYINASKGFESYFVSFASGARLEIMQMEGIPDSKDDVMQQFTGLIHFAIGVESRQAVDELTEQLRIDGYEVIGEPRVTGDGYYESVILDPERNRVEIASVV